MIRTADTAAFGAHPTGSKAYSIDATRESRVVGILTGDSLRVLSQYAQRVNVQYALAGTGK